MWGAATGDVIGSTYEWENARHRDVALFPPRSTYTDDTVLTVAIADALLRGLPYLESILAWFRRFPGVGYGCHFQTWAEEGDGRPYGSFGNGSAMRVSAAAWARDTLDAVRAEARLTALPTHDHPEGVKGACATAEAIFLARMGADKATIQAQIGAEYGYDVRAPIRTWRRRYAFDLTCAGTVPQAIRCFLEGEVYESTLRNVLEIGGDSDTLGAIAGAIAEAAWGVPDPLLAEARARLHPDLAAVLDAASARWKR